MFMFFYNQQFVHSKNMNDHFRIRSLNHNHLQYKGRMVFVHILPLFHCFNLMLFQYYILTHIWFIIKFSGLKLVKIFVFVIV